MQYQEHSSLSGKNCDEAWYIFILVKCISCNRLSTIFSNSNKMDRGRAEDRLADGFG